MMKNKAFIIILMLISTQHISASENQFTKGKLNIAKAVSWRGVAQWEREVAKFPGVKNFTLSGPAIMDLRDMIRQLQLRIERLEHIAHVNHGSHIERPEDEIPSAALVKFPQVGSSSQFESAAQKVRGQSGTAAKEISAYDQMRARAAERSKVRAEQEIEKRAADRVARSEKLASAQKDEELASYRARLAAKRAAASK